MIQPLMTTSVADEEAMQDFGAHLALQVKPPAIIFLEGPLGAGKTTLARGFLRGLGYHGIVRSPTYTLVEPYQLAGLTVYHFDLYRLTHAEELEMMGARDYFREDSICLIEWPERGESWLPISHWTCYIEPDVAGRKVSVRSYL